jgi:hypothetical protein
MTDKTEYTFTFDRNDETKFREVLSRLEPEEYNIIKDIHLVDEKDPRYSDKSAVIEMEEEACLTFRLGMKQVKIRRKRTPEEEAYEKELEDRHKVKITVQVDPSLLPPSAGGTAGTTP